MKHFLLGGICSMIGILTYTSLNAGITNFEGHRFNGIYISNPENPTFCHAALYVDERTGPTLQLWNAPNGSRLGDDSRLPFAIYVDKDGTPIMQVADRELNKVYKIDLLEFARERNPQ